MEKNFDSPALKGIMLFHFKTITFIFQVESACYSFSSGVYTFNHSPPPPPREGERGGAGSKIHD